MAYDECETLEWKLFYVILLFYVQTLPYHCHFFIFQAGLIILKFILVDCYEDGKENALAIYGLFIAVLNMLI